MYFHWLSKDEVIDIYETEKALVDAGTLFDTKNLLDVLLYYTYSPKYYSSAFIKGTLKSRESFNMKRYNEAVLNSGRVEFGSGNTKRGENLPPSVITTYQGFSCDPLIDFYLEKLIGLCEENGIQFIYQSTPVSEITYQNLNADMVKDYRAYMEQIQREHPNTVIEAEMFAYDNTLFSDENHLTITGAAQFSQEMREKYANIFQKPYT